MAFETVGLKAVFEGADSFVRDAKKVEGASDGLGSKLGGVAKLAAGAGLALAGITAGGLVASVKVAADFEHQMSAVGAVTKASKAELEALSDLAMKIGRETAFSSTETAAAMEELAKQGLTVEQILSGAAVATTDLAAAGGTDMVTAATAAAQSMRVWGLEGKDLTNVVNRIAGVANVSQFGVEDMTQALGMGAGIAEAAGFSFEEFSTAIAAIAPVSNSGSDAATSFKNAIMRMMNPTEEAKDVMTTLGISFHDAEGNMKSLPDIIDNVKVATAGMTQQERDAALSTIFLSDGMKAMIPMLELGKEGFIAMDKSMGENDAAEQARRRMDNFSGALEQLKGSIESIMIEIGLRLLPGLSKAALWLADKLPAIFDKLGPAFDAVGKTIGDIGQKVFEILSRVDWQRVGLVIAQVFTGLRSAGEAIARVDWGRIFGMIVDAVKSVIAAVKPIVEYLGPKLVAAGKAIFEALVPVGKALKEDLGPPLMEFAEVALPIVVGALGILMDIIKIAAPIIGIVLVGAIQQIANAFSVAAAVIAAVVKIISGILNVFIGVFTGDWDRAWKGVQQIFTGVWDAIKAIIKGVFDNFLIIFGVFFRALDQLTGGKLTEMKDKVIGIFNAMKDAVTTAITATKDAVVLAWTATKDAITAAAGAVETAIMTPFNAAKNAMAGVWSGITGGVTAGWNATLGAINAAADAVQDAITSPFNAAKDAMGGIWEDIKTAVSTGWGAVQSFVDGAIDTLAGAMKKPYEIVRDAVGGIWDAAGRFVSGAVGSIVSLISGFIGSIVDGINTVLGWFNIPGVPKPSFGAPEFVPSAYFVPAREKGGPVHQSGMVLVGEGGPELVRLPGGSDVLSNKDSIDFLKLIAGNASIGWGWDDVKDASSAFKNVAIDPVTGHMKEGLEWVADNIKEFAKIGAKAVLERALSAAGHFVPTLPGIFAGMPARIMEKLFDKMVSWVGDLITGASGLLPKASGSLSTPLSGYSIEQEFGMTDFAQSGAYAGRGHSGMDLGAAMGTPVYAADGGIVSTVADYGASSYGKMIILAHNGLSTLYGHLSRIMVSVNEAVSKSQQIGAVGSTGYSTGPHLHFETRENGIAVNPRNYVAFGTGGIAFGPTMGLLGERGPEAVIPLSYMRAMAPALQAAGGAGGGFSIDLRGSTFTGTPQENAAAIQSVVERTIRKRFGRDAYLAGARI